MNAMFASFLLLILISSIVTITEISASKASDKGERITKKANDKLEDIGDKLRALGGSNNNYNNDDKDVIKNEFDDSEDKKDNNDKPSIADELRELAKLKEEGILTEEEFQEMKEDLIE
jgi:hypothetical protein